MSVLLEMLKQNKDFSMSKSYLIGLERGRVWAEDCADYFEMREWSESEVNEFDDLILPDNESIHFRIMSDETPLDWNAYLKGWIEGVREIKQKY